MKLIRLKRPSQWVMPEHSVTMVSASNQFVIFYIFFTRHHIDCSSVAAVVGEHFYCYLLWLDCLEQNEKKNVALGLRTEIERNVQKYELIGF